MLIFLQVEFFCEEKVFGRMTDLQLDALIYESKISLSFLSGVKTLMRVADFRISSKKRFLEELRTSSLRFFDLQVNGKYAMDLHQMRHIIMYRVDTGESV